MCHLRKKIEMITLYHKNQKCTANKNSTNISEKKVGLARYIQIYKLTLKPTMLLPECLKVSNGQVFLFINDYVISAEISSKLLFLLTEKFPFLGYFITGNRNTFATLKNSNVMLNFQCKRVSPPLYTKNQCFERVPVF